MADANLGSVRFDVDTRSASTKLTNFANRVQRVKKEFTDLEREFRENSTALNAYERRTKATERVTDKLGKEIRDVTKALKDYNAELQKTTRMQNLGGRGRAFYNKNNKH